MRTLVLDQGYQPHRIISWQLQVPVLRAQAAAVHADLRPRRAARTGRPDALGEHRDGLLRLQRAEGLASALTGGHEVAEAARTATMAAGGCVQHRSSLSVPETWLNWVYWHGALEEDSST